MLSSQAPRVGSDQKNMTSRGRNLTWLWVSMAIVGCAIAGLWLWLGGESSSEPRAASAAAPRVAAAPDAPAKPDHTAVKAPPTSAPTRTRVPANVPTLTLDKPADGAPVGQSSSSTQTGPKPDVSIRADGQTQAPTARPPAKSPAQHAQAIAASYGSSDSQLAKGMELIADEKYVEGRAVLSQLLLDAPQRLTPADAQTVRDTLASVNKSLIFSPDIDPNDPVAEAYIVQSGDLLSRIAPRYKTPYQFIESINGVNANRIRVGQQLKVVRGPFTVRVVKDEFRMDLFLTGKDGVRVYARSFPVGLGTSDSTPVGAWIVSPGRKAVNPDWRNPRTNEYFTPNDPKNPIGEYWLALTGTDENTSKQQGYGIHGTIDPDSIGTQASMGCIRLRDGDIEQVFNMLWEGATTVEIVP